MRVYLIFALLCFSFTFLSTGLLGQDDCRVDFISSEPDTATAGATLYENIPTEHDCRDLCMITPACKSYQIDTLSHDALCWIQYNQEEEVYSRPGVIEHTKQLQCSSAPGCVPIFTLLWEDEATSGATARPSITNEDSCRDNCAQDPECVSYQIDNDENRSALCWIQTEMQRILDRANYLRSKVKEFIKNTTYCSDVTTSGMTPLPPCSYTFEEQDRDFASMGATSFPSLTTKDSCRQACLNLAGCISYQIDTNPGSDLCWLQYAPNARDNIFSRTDVVEFFKVCPNSTSSKDYVSP